MNEQPSYIPQAGDDTASWTEYKRNLRNMSRLARQSEVAYLAGRIRENSPDSWEWDMFTSQMGALISVLQEKGELS